MRAINAILIRNLTNFIRDRVRLFFTVFMSVVFLFIFSFVMKSSTTGIANPTNYLIAGIIIMTVFQAALNNSMLTIEDISSGFMKEILVAPISRYQISMGQILSSAVVAVLQGIIILVLGLFIGLSTDLLQFIKLTAIMILVGITFSSMGLYLATLAKNSTNFQLIIGIITMPLTFLSGAYIPTTILPKFLLPIIYLNPLTYTTSIYRYITLRMEHYSNAMLIKEGVAFDIHGFIITPYLGLIIVLIIGIIFFILCVKQFNKADFSKVKVSKDIMF
ncbi:ABC transporter permease [Clostridium sp. JS66]|uniref:ABC transporter permease n=1 Tax=Clostridium sp. JS66 TaxID=3064705 RepID=UPI00298D69AD|nr:ABC transporter permease [Clostridium sp. JS66]WPC42718.1 ABC transporter permease [Clostridium sp. JS66]